MEGRRVAVGRNRPAGDCRWIGRQSGKRWDRERRVRERCRASLRWPRAESRYSVDSGELERWSVSLDRLTNTARNFDGRVGLSAGQCVRADDV